MQDKMLFSTEAYVSGRMESELQYSHEIEGVKYYAGTIRVKNAAGREDEIPLIASELFIEKGIHYKGQYVCVSGEFRSRNEKNAEDQGRSFHLSLYLFATEPVKTGEPESVLQEDSNTILLAGYICKKGLFKSTLSGKTLYNFILAVNYSYGRSSYLPCITWGKTAAQVMQMEVGQKVSAAGRIQSRRYRKKLSDGKFQVNTTYEVCLDKVNAAGDVI